MAGNDRQDSEERIRQQQRQRRGLPTRPSSHVRDAAARGRGRHGRHRVVARSPLSIRTTDIYQHADLAMKERALDCLAPRKAPRGRYRPPDSLLAFLEAP